jgi:hypothetical protein
VRKVAVKNGLTLRQIIEEALTIWLLQKSGEEGREEEKASEAPEAPPQEVEPPKGGETP